MNELYYPLKHSLPPPSESRLKTINVLQRGITSPGLSPTLLYLLLTLTCWSAFPAVAQRSSARWLLKNGRALFPIGSYELPKNDGELRAMADAGFDLVHCGNVTDLDRAQAVGMLGWISVPLQSGAADNDSLRKAVEAARNHPALAVWEGPDEVVWSFTAYSGLYRRGVYKSPDEWWRQTPFAVQRSETEAGIILPKLREGCRLVRQLDRSRHPIWINEAAESDLKFIRGYLDDVDITGCDIYPIHENRRLPETVGDYTQRYQSVGRSKPVWMVLQAFSWHELTPPKDEHLVYPSFIESRLMAYSAIAHGAKGILYWGSEVVPKESPFRPSLFAVASELTALQPFLTAKDETGVRLELTESKRGTLAGDRGVSWIVRRANGEWLVALVNEDNQAHMGVEVVGLKQLNRRSLELLYGSETATVEHGGFVTRLQPYEVKVFATSRKWESPRRRGRDFQ